MAREKKTRREGKKVGAVSRRSFIKAAGAGLAVVGLGPIIIVSGRTRAAKKRLRIVQWKHPDPHFDEWFKNTYVKECGEKNTTEVLVENHP